jgi:protein involved in polysaccharide export with SLBB domain
MKSKLNYLFFISLFFLLLPACTTQRSAIKDNSRSIQAAPKSPPEYLIQINDKLDIKFFYNPELNESVTVRPDGKISLQLVDDVQAGGLTPSQLDKALTDQYSRELKMPVISVIVQSFAGHSVYIGGEVNRPGLIELTPGMTPLQAVIQAGGLKETAMPGGVIIVRKGPDNRPIPMRLDLQSSFYGNHSAASLQLQSSDIVYVPKTFIAKANKFVKQYIEDLLLFRGVSLGFSYQLHSEDNN